MRDLDGLIEKIEGLEGPSREVDAEICIALQYGGLNSDGASNVRTDPDWEGDLLFEIEGDDHPECCNPIPALTSSLDAAIALVKRALPGWSWGCWESGTGDKGQATVWNPRMAPGYNDEQRAYNCPSPAIALCLALLRALQSQEKQ